MLFSPRLVLFTVAIVGALLALPLIWCGYPYPTHDGQHHVNWVECFSRQLWSGELYPRWLGTSNNGFGSPSFFYYGPLPYYVAAVFWRFAPLGSQAGFALGWCSALALVLSGVAAFWCLRRFSVGPWAAAIGAILYMVAPYHLAIDLLDRGANADFWAFVWMPLIIGSLEQFSHVGEGPMGIGGNTGIRTWIGNAIPDVFKLALWIAGLLLTHLLTVIVFAPMAAAFALCRGRRTFRGLLTASVIALGLTALYWLPVISYQFLICSSTWSWTNGDELGKTLLFPFLDWRRPLVTDDAFNRHLLYTFLGFVLACAIGLWSAWNLRSCRRARTNVLFCALVLVGCLLMMLPISLPLYNYPSPLRYIQFSWRFMACAAFAQSLLVGFLLDSFWKKRAGDQVTSSRLCLGLAAASLALALGSACWLDTQKYREAFFDHGVLRTTLLRADAFTADFKEYLPITAMEKEASLDFPNAGSVEREPKIVGKGSAATTQKDARDWIIKVDAESPCTVVIPQFWFPGWKVSVSPPDGDFPVGSAPESGLVQIDARPGRHTIDLQLGALWPERIGGWITLGTVVALLTVGFLQIRGKFFRDDAVHETILPWLQKDTAWLVVLAGLLLAAPVICCGFPRGTHDGVIHHNWVECFSRQLWAGELYPRWLAAPNSGFGTPAFFYYAPFSCYAAAVFWCCAPLGAQAAFALGWTTALALILSGLSALWCFRRFVVNRWAAVVGAIIYMAAPYHLTIDLLDRGAIAEFWAFVWMPLIIGILENISRGVECKNGNPKGIPWSVIGLFRSPEDALGILKLALAMGCLLVTHVPTTITFIPIATLFALYRGWPTLKRFLMAGFIVIGLCAVFWLPMVAYRNFTVASEWVIAIWHTVFFPTLDWHRPLFRDDVYNRRLLQIFVGFVLVLVLGAVSLLLLKHERSARKNVIFFVLVLMGCLVMMLPISLPLYRVLFFLKYIQFSWRFMACATLAHGFLTAILLDVFWRNGTRGELQGSKLWLGRAAAVFVLVIAVYSGSTLGAEKYREAFFDNGKLRSLPVMADVFGKDANGEYVPILGDEEDSLLLFPPAKFAAQQPLLSQGEGRIAGRRQNARHWILDVQMTSSGIVTIPQFWFPGWKASESGRRATFRVQHETRSGLVQVEVPAGRHIVDAYLAPLWPEFVGEWASFVTACGLVLAAIFLKLRRPLPQMVAAVEAASEDSLSGDTGAVSGIRFSDELHRAREWSQRMSVTLFFRIGSEGKLLWRRKGGLLLVAAVGLVLVFPLLRWGYPSPTHDGWTHINLIEDFSRQLWGGELYPRWISLPNNGFGTSAFFFYGPLSYYVGAFFWRLTPFGAQAGFALGWAAALALIFSGAGAFWCLRRFGVGQWAAAIGAIIYMVAPYHYAIGLLYRGALSEFWAFVWLPFIIGTLEDLSPTIEQMKSAPDGKKRNGIAGLFWTRDTVLKVFRLGLLFAGLLFTHPPTAVEFALVAAGFALFLGRQIFIAFLTSELIAVALSAVYWVPAIAYRSYTRASQIGWANGESIGDTMFYSSFQKIVELEREFSANDVFSQNLRQVFLGLVIVSQMSLLAVWSLKFYRKEERNIIYWVLAMAGCLAMMLPISLPVYHCIGLLRNIQFSWRFMSCATLIHSLLIAFLLNAFWRKSAANELSRTRLWLGRVAALAILGVALFSSIALSAEKFHEDFFKGGKWWWKSKNADIFASDFYGEHIPIGADMEKAEQMFPNVIFVKPSPKLLEGVGQVTGSRQNARRWIIEVQAQSSCRIVVPQFWFPGWQASGSGLDKNFTVHSARESGLVQIEVPPGTHSIDLRLSDLGPERIGRWVSLGSLCVLGLAAAFLRFRKKHPREAKIAGVGKNAVLVD